MLQQTFFLLFNVLFSPFFLFSLLLLSLFFFFFLGGGGAPGAPPPESAPGYPLYTLTDNYSTPLLPSVHPY